MDIATFYIPDLCIWLYLLVLIGVFELVEDWVELSGSSGSAGVPAGARVRSASIIIQFLERLLSELISGFHVLDEVPICLSQY